jgi:hypothetical protein
MRWAEYEARLAAAMRAPDPVQAVHAFAPDADADGVRLTALLVARLRFERLLRGSRLAAAWFEADAAGFTAAFAAYHEAVVPLAFFPREEAWRFFAWGRAVAWTRGRRRAPD